MDEKFYRRFESFRRSLAALEEIMTGEIVKSVCGRLTDSYLNLFEAFKDIVEREYQEKTGNEEDIQR